MAARATSSSTRFTVTAASARSDLVVEGHGTFRGWAYSAPTDLNLRARIHFVTTHFSPRATGAPACSDLWSTCMWLLVYSKYTPLPRRGVTDNPTAGKTVSPP